MKMFIVIYKCQQLEKCQMSFRKSRAGPSVVMVHTVLHNNENQMIIDT